MTLKKVAVSTEYEFSYDPESQKFKNTLESYRIVFGEDGDENSLMEHIALNVMRRGVHDMMEGVGYLRVNGRINEKDDSGITIIEEDPLWDFDVIG